MGKKNKKKAGDNAEAVVPEETKAEAKPQET